MSRNRGKPTIRELSYATPSSEERDLLSDAAINGGPIVTAIIGAAMIELELDTLLRQRFPRITDSIWATMVRENGPFSTMDQKITAAFAFRIFDEATRDNLKIVKNIRNAFAHAKRLIDFSHELIVAELNKIQIPGFRKVIHRELRTGTRAQEKTAMPPNFRYVLLCMVISTHLIRKNHVALRAKSKRLYRKAAKLRSISVSPLAQALIRSTDLQNKLTGSYPLSSLQNQISGPNALAQAGYAAGLLRFFDPSSNPYAPPDAQKDKTNKK